MIPETIRYDTVKRAVVRTTLNHTSDGTPSFCVTGTGNHLVHDDFDMETEREVAMFDSERRFQSPYGTLEQVEQALGQVAEQLERVLESASISKTEA